MNKVHPKFSELLDSADSCHCKTLDGRPRIAKDISSAGHLYFERRRRDIWFEGGLFWEPSWDLLLYLYDAYQEGQNNVSIDSLSKKPFMVSPESTARWLDLLSANGYISTGHNNAHIALTPKAITAIEGYLGDTEHATQAHPA